MHDERWPASWRGQPRRMGAPKGAPVAPPSTINSMAVMYDESSEARKSTALASSSGSPQRPRAIEEETKSASLADCSAVSLARDPRFQMRVLVAPGATTLTRILRGARSAAMARAYNNWVVDYCKAEPHRLKAVAVLPLQDVEASVVESAAGCGGGSAIFVNSSAIALGEPVALGSLLIPES